LSVIFWMFMPRSVAGPGPAAKTLRRPRPESTAQPMLLSGLLPLLDAIAPLRWAEPWDNVGLLTGDPDAPAARVLLAIDLPHAVADEAIRNGCALVVAYHPALFDPIKRVRHDGILHKAIRAGLAIYSPHTALDVAPGGTNDLLADALGLQAR